MSTSTSTDLATTEEQPPNDFRDLWTLARVASHTDGLVPAGLRGKRAETFMVLLAGQELGLSPVQALKQVHVIGGRVTFSAELLRARILEAGHQLHVLKHEDAEVVVRGVRRDGSSLVVGWDLARAEQAGLLKRNADSWTKYPRAMLLARATSELARAIFPDVTVGLLSYAGPEVADMEGVEPPMGELVEYDGRTRVIDMDTGEVVDVEDDEDAAWIAEAREDNDS